MRILHVCLANFYIDNYSYQENLLPKYHKLLGNEVQIVASTETFDTNGCLTYIEPKEYYNENGILVKRIPYVSYFPHKVAIKLRKYIGLLDVINSFRPDIFFIHDIQFLDIGIIADYAKRHNVVVYADCHADFSNSARTFLSRYFLHGIIYKWCARRINPYVKTFYGVLPARVEFLKQVYKLPEEKIQLLEMGLDDELCSRCLSETTKKDIREKYHIKESDYLIVTGGKIDLFKTQTLLLMQAVKDITNRRVKLIVFGSIVPELKERFKSLCVDNQIMYAGWMSTEESLKHFAAADLVVFPGRHSVYWEQVVGLGIPLLVKYWDGTTHVNVDNNVRFLKEDTKEEIQNWINHLLFTEEYYQMLKSAQNCRNTFLYSEIAKRSIDIN